MEQSKKYIYVKHLVKISIDIVLFKVERVFYFKEKGKATKTASIIKKLERTFKFKIHQAKYF
jgi:hypothetical protein